MVRRRLGWLLALGLGAFPLAAQQESVRLRDRLQDLFRFGTCGKPLCLDNSVNATNGHGNHFLPDLAASNGALISFLNDAIAATAANYPLPASGSGVTYQFAGGLPVRTSTSLGPIFGERAQTLGKGRLVTGANLTGIAFTSLRGVPLEGLILTFTHDDVAPDGLGQPLRENDLLQVRLDLNVNLLVSTFFATYGVTDRVDIGVAVPVVHSSVSGRSVGQFLPFGIPTSHFFAGDSSQPVLTANAATFGSHTGFGDVAVRVKANVFQGERIRLALMADTRLPTGSEEDLTGAGHFGLRALAIAAGQFGSLSPHLNLGYAMRGGHGAKDAVLVTAGFDQLVASWATLAVDAISEWETGANALTLPSSVRFQYPVERTVELSNIPEMRDHRVNGSLGFRFRTPGGPIVTSNILVPLRHGGLQARLIWTAGIDLSF
ncbi:MAG: transporter [Gemmatimonadales bacterium]